MKKAVFAGVIACALLVFWLLTMTMSSRSSREALRVSSAQAFRPLDETDALTGLRRLGLRVRDGAAITSRTGDTLELRDADGGAFRFRRGPDDFVVSERRVGSAWVAEAALVESDRHRGKLSPPWVRFQRCAWIHFAVSDGCAVISAEIESDHLTLVAAPGKFVLECARAR